jgi:Flp pilus assembly pilin Flp
MPARTKRKGATMMEYLMMISLILTVCLSAIGYLGGSNNASMSNSSNKINKSLNKGK